MIFFLFNVSQQTKYSTMLLHSIGMNKLPKRELPRTVLIIRCFAMVFSFSFIVVVEAVTGEVVLPLLKVW